MSDGSDPRAELAKVEAAIAAQEGLRGILPEEQIAAALTALHAKRDALVGQVSGAGALAQKGGVAAGQGGAAVRDNHGNVVVINAGAVSLDLARLSALWGKAAVSDADLQQATADYLAWIFDRYQYLDFRGMGVSDRVALKLPLLSMYVPGRARVEAPEGETWHRPPVRVAGRPVSEAEAREIGQRLSEPRPLPGLLAGSSGLIVLGDPGSGKTTFLKYLALAVAAGRGEELGLGERLPVLIPLSAYANALAKDEVSLVEFAGAYAEQRGLDLPLAQLIERALSQGKALLLLDGLDEVRETRLRRLVVARIEDACSRHRMVGNKLVLTSRIVGYREVRPAGEGFAEATLVDFEDAEIEEFVSKWTAGMEEAARGAGLSAVEAALTEREELLAAVHRNVGVRSLAGNPLLLTILALMKRQGVTLPDRRVELYQACIKALLQSWNLARSLDGRLGKDLDERETTRILAPLALWMQETSPGVGLARQGEIELQLERIYGGRKHPEPARAARELLEDVHQHTGVLLDRGGGSYGFIHLTFQEYLAAAALADLGQKDVVPIADALVPQLEKAAWREVILLTVGYVANVQKRDQVAGELLEELVGRGSETSGHAVALAGEAAADAGVGGVPESYRAKLVEELLDTMRAEEAVRPINRAEAGRALARLGDPRREVTTLAGMWEALREVPAGGFWMGSEEEDRAAADSEKPKHWQEISYDYRIGHFPVTVAHFREYLERGGRRPEVAYGLSRPANEPMVTVSWNEALVFCRWLTREWRREGLLLGEESVTLPSEAEWEKAARGMDGRIYPWGMKWEANRANDVDTGIREPNAVGCFPSGVSPFGCEEMSGNVWEWTRNPWATSWYKADFVVGDQREDLKVELDGRRVLRGGAFGFSFFNTRCAVRGYYPAKGRDGDLGFRVVVLPFPSEL